MTDALKRGDKFLDIEEGVGVLGISLFLLPVLLHFNYIHSDEVRGLVDINPNTLKDYAAYLSGFLHKYQSFYW